MSEKQSSDAVARRKAAALRENLKRRKQAARKSAAPDRPADPAPKPGRDS